MSCCDNGSSLENACLYIQEAYKLVSCKDKGA